MYAVIKTNQIVKVNRRRPRERHFQWPKGRSRFIRRPSRKAYLESENNEDRVCSCRCLDFATVHWICHRPNGQIANLADSVLVNVQRNLYALKVFLDRNAQLFVSAPGEQVGTRHNNEQDAWKIENGSYSQLHSLLTRTVEALSFVLLLIDYHVEDLTAQYVSA